MQVVEYYQGPEVKPWSQAVYISFILVPILLLNIIRRLEYFTPFVFIANICYLLGLLIILQYLCQSLGSTANVAQFQGWATLPLYFGTFMFAFEFVGMVSDSSGLIVTWKTRKIRSY